MQKYCSWYLKQSLKIISLKVVQCKQWAIRRPVFMVHDRLSFTSRRNEWQVTSQVAVELLGFVVFTTDSKSKGDVRFALCFETCMAWAFTDFQATFDQHSYNTCSPY